MSGRDWSSDVCSSDLATGAEENATIVVMSMPGRTGDSFITTIVAFSSAPVASRVIPPLASGEIGRASCRERVEIPVGHAAFEKHRTDGLFQSYTHGRD